MELIILHDVQGDTLALVMDTSNITQEFTVVGENGLDGLPDMQQDYRRIVHGCLESVGLRIGSQVIEQEPDDSMDGDFESGMTSAGMGTDEDYGGGSEHI